MNNLSLAFRLIETMNPDVWDGNGDSIPFTKDSILAELKKSKVVASASTEIFLSSDGSAIHLHGIEDPRIAGFHGLFHGDLDTAVDLFMKETAMVVEPENQGKKEM